MTLEEFLKQCEQSGDGAYAALKSLLEKLEDPKTRTEARVFLSDLQSRVGSSDDCFHKYHFRIQDIYLDRSEGYQGRKKLTMMVIPSIFMPEDWSFTFYEGLNRHPDSIFKEMTVAELGCGNGWITIAIAEKWLPAKVYGLDINPRAVKVSCINLYMNAFDEKGQPIYDAEKKTLLDRVEFHESDLLSYCREHDIKLERIVGCIPQILNPNPEAMSKMITENASEEFLHSLSNYCALQGFLEDQFGLGLIARAVEEGIAVIKPTGILIFNMGGRPGQGVCRCLFERRGFRVTRLWQTKVLQAGDTDISALVEIEKNSPHRFEFFMGLSGDQPICARTAWAYGKAGGRISHGLSVYSCQLRQPNQKVVVFPSRTVAIENALRLFSPHLAIVDEHLTRNLPRKWLTSLAIETAENGLSDDVVTVIEAPRQSDLMIELIKRLKPQVVVTGIAHFEAVTSSAFVQLLDATGEIGSRLFLDISDHFELSSLPGTIGVLKYLSGTPLPSHAAIVCGLVKNQVYSDLEVAFVISEEEAILKALSKTVEILEGNTSLISQYYYGCIFHELLSFQLTDRHPHLERRSEKSKSVEVIGFATSAISVLSNAELSISDDGYPLVRMDVDQWFLPVPSPVKAAIFESFSRQNMTESEIDVTPCIKQFVQTEYGFPTDSGTEFIFSDCSQALLSKLVLCCIQEGGTMCFPAGSNGNYVSVAKFLKANTVHIPTNSERGFKLTEDILIKVLETMKKPWVYISGPTINPTGLLYSNQEMENILSACARFGARVVIDTSFSGLEFEYEGWGGWNLGSCLSKISSSGNPSFCVSLLGGLSLKLLSGALKFAFLALNEPILIEAFHSFPGLSKPHCTDKYTIKKLLSLREQKGGLLDVAMEQIRILENRAKCLKEVLENCGWDVLRPCAGVSMVAKPSFLGKAVKVNHSLKHTGSGEQDATYEIKLTDASLREAVAKTTGLCINSGSWTGIPGYCRFTIALEESEFEQALACLVKFKSIVDN
ncbi:hypothetical protein ES319_D06G143000v1 [Gossypium barbadense]|uniref:methionine S-methyltransferase n=2 Tax=Gossypium TaxID=3633 RepID=A0A5J5R3J5_GOSBA|nr:hypothetical protein ES319_D06G143000v1 [Gossypium barbadense]TYG65036.1 hypothetical protein ES288_D06G152700v1 [Gossypium darwinii]